MRSTLLAYDCRFTVNDDVSLRQPHWDVAFSGASGSDVTAVLRRWSDLYVNVFRVRFDAPPKAAAKIKIGFISSWFCNSAVGRLMTGLFVHLDRERFEVHAIHVPGRLGVRRDDFTDKIDHVSQFSHELPLGDFPASQRKLEVRPSPRN